MIEGVIYKYTSPNGKVYIGQTIREERRRRDFLGEKYIYAGPKINKARKKYGPENFKYDVLIKVESDNIDELHHYLNILEIGFIKMYDSVKNGYNSCNGGNNTSGHTLCEDARKRIGEAHKGKPSWNKGIPMKEETKQKLREVKKGQIPWTTGKHWDEETKKKISEAHKGQHYMKGVPKSEAHKKALSESRKGTKRVYDSNGHFKYIKITDEEICHSLW